MSERHFSQVAPEVLQRYQFVPLQTRHHGILYRSRSEARWAVFLETLGLRFEYEREGFDLGDGMLYLPDFWVPALSAWVEIKGGDPNDLECEKAHRLAVGSGHRVYVFFGGHLMPNGNDGPTRGYVLYPDGASDFDQCWCECPTCGRIGIEYEGRSDRLPCKVCHCATYGKVGCTHEGKCPRISRSGDKGVNYNTPRLRAAFAAARTARFGT